ncbi:hypothetical protein FBU30_005856 [Linnemannia zychae]|nr:hypothetical protein FBU30_005856 [Linnemannia zychae]
MTSQQTHIPSPKEQRSIEHLNSNAGTSFSPSQPADASSHDSFPLTRLHAATSSSKESTPTANATSEATTPTSERNPSIKRRVNTRDSNDTILFDDPANSNSSNHSSQQLPRPSEDDDLERGVQGNIIAMNEPNGSLTGLTTDEAITQSIVMEPQFNRKLIDVATEVLDQYHTPATSMQHFIKYITSVPSISIIIAILGLLVFYIYGTLSASPRQFRLTGVIVEVAILAAIFIWNAYIHRRDLQLRGREVKDRVRGVILELEDIRVQPGQELKVPSIPSISTVRVIRSGIVRTLPSNLIVKGDLIEMVFGDAAPCNVLCSLSKHGIESISQSQYLHQHYHHRHHTHHSTSRNPSPTREYFLSRREIFQPSLFGSPPSEEWLKRHQELKGRYTFEVLETPLEQILHTALDPTPRPNSLIQKQLQVISRIIFFKVVLAIALIALVINLLRYVLKEVLQLHHPNQGPEQLLVLPIYAVLPLIPLALPTLLQISKAFTNATILVLFNTLQISKTEFEDEKDVDEFDVEAPPPTKNVDIARKEVWRRFWRLLTRWGNSGQDFDDGLTRSTNLVESLGGITVICSIDKEGTIATVFPEVEQVLVATEDEDTVVLDVLEDSQSPNGIRFEDKDWESYIQSLKPIGLNQLLNTNCSTLSAVRRRESHRKCNTLQYHGKTRAAQQTCLCRLGKEIGFTSEALYPFTLQKEILCYHPYIPMPLMTFGKLTTFEIPTMLSTIYHERASNSYMVLTDGHVECVVECCTEYWDGTGVQDLNDTMLKKISDFYQTAVINDLQCIAYAYRPLVIEHGPEPLNFNSSTNGFITLPVRILPEIEDNKDELQSTVNVNLSSYSREHDGIDEEPIPESMRRSSPGHKMDISSLPDPVNIVIHIDGESDAGDMEENYGASVEDQGMNTSKVDSGPLRRWQKLRELDLARAEAEDEAEEHLDPAPPVDSQQFIEEAIQGQIFLGMTTLAHQPKTNVCDFIEDLGLAGIRFVYFSPTSERESKAFADRLGLETDWNSCILLSSASDPFGASTGYLESYDIKAQLPRGIENIRPHLEAVDDIPLHVSLFAECGPEAAAEMIKIFQDYGEVVCCIGSSLNINNTAAFAKADISVGIEPIKMNSSPESRSAFSLGSKINSLSCGLIMHSETSLYALTQVIREARRLLNSQRQGVVFMIASLMSLTLLLLISYCFLLPPAMTGYQILWIMWIIVPLLILSYFFSPHEPDTMTMMPSTQEYVTTTRPSSLYLLLPCSLYPSYWNVCLRLPVFWKWDSMASMVKRGAVGTIIRTKLHYDYLGLVYGMDIQYFYESNSFSSYIPTLEESYMDWCKRLVVINGPHKVNDLPWWLFVVAFLWPIAFMPIQEIVKARDMKECIRAQKLAKLEFNTKLGMHSPL